MCGIAGILKVWTTAERELALRTPHTQAIPERWLDILDDSIKHRGPDGRGRFRDRAIRADGCVVDVAFVHRRLSIIDHTGGRQPMVWSSAPALHAGRLLSDDEIERHNRGVIAAASDGLRHGVPGSENGAGQDHVAVVFNGCIYNHRELRAELQSAGHVFGTDHSDTEVLVHGWREWKQGLASRLDGMYALAIWDRRSATLTAARDYAGEKPLYTNSLEDVYPTDQSWAGIVAFGSTAGAMFRLAVEVGQSTSIGKDVVHWLHAGYGLYCGPSREWPRGTVADVAEYRRHRTNKIVPRGWSDELATHVRSPRLGRPGPDDVDRHVRAAVVSRLAADVEVGCFLSGGVDSALIATHAKAALGGVRTFTVRMPDRAYDESPIAERVASLIGTRHSTLDTDACPAADLEMLIGQLGLPFGDSSLLPTHWVSRATRREVKVALSGDGADELFAGYERQRAARWIPFAGWLGPAASLGLLDSSDPRSTRDRLRRLYDASRGWKYADLGAVVPAALLRHVLKSEINPLTSWAKGSDDGGDAVEEAVNHDFSTYLTGDLLRKTDTASMGVALEARAPFLALDVVREARTATIESLMPRGERKGLLRQVARRYLPAEIVDRPKMGFAIPIGEWFRTDYGGLRTMLLDHLNSTEPFGPPALGIDLNTAFIRRMLDEHLGTGPSGLVKRDHSQRLYMLLVLSVWARWIGGLR